MKNDKKQDYDQDSHNLENEPWIPEYQKPNVKNDLYQDKDPNEQQDTPENPSIYSNRNENPEYPYNTNHEYNPSADKQINDPDDDDDLDDPDNEDFEEEGGFEEKDNDYRKKEERDLFDKKRE